MNPPSFFAELKRRNVYRMAVAYAVAAWLLSQVSSLLLVTIFQAPAWVMKVLVAALALGFPVTLVWAWAFEITPEGVKRTEDVAPAKSISRRTGGKLLALPLSLGLSLQVCSHFVYCVPDQRPTSMKRNGRAVLSSRL